MDKAQSHPPEEHTKSKFTAVISDLHLCEAEPAHPEIPLWKRYKSKDFFFDHIFENFLQHLIAKADGDPVELVLNGDVFDFDSVVALPEDAPYKISWLETRRGLHPEEDKSSFKIRRILEDHQLWVKALHDFVLKGNRVVFVVGNHDLELHFPKVQRDIIEALDLPDALISHVRFCAFFYISNGDTLIEHGNQYDAYCLCQNPINPMVQKFNRVEIRIPFGDLAGRYLINGMGFFNPHVDTNFIMSMREYFNFFWKYLLRAQPLIMWTWFWGSCVILAQSFIDRLLPELKDPLTIEDRIEEIAKRANATPRMVRELKELTVDPAASNPISLMKELWLDRALLVVIGFLGVFQLFAFVKLVYDISLFWAFIPLAIFIPFFIFYSKSVTSYVGKYKEPSERILRIATQITRTKRVVYGHTHEYRHEMIGNIEHLNSGCWSPAFLDVECTKPFGKRTFVWIEGEEGVERKAYLLEFKEGHSQELFGRRRKFDREKKETLRRTS
jgi:UDP-2,3-diacylglucosamine pyrophosphatase LpxH